MAACVKKGQTNIYAIGNKGGGRPLYKSAEELEAKVIEYFEHCQKNELKTTLTGMVLFLGYSHRENIYNIKDPELKAVVDRARLAIECGYETNLHSHNPTGSIFALKNMGWKDKVEQEIRQTNIMLDMDFDAEEDED